ncbi:hypothetical protein ABW20_dc0109487 [Dactylellina cionopaga]|nr:hypothetical protein ABW20_dc0109487 [Dactylellina cionopaga]
MFPLTIVERFDNRKYVPKNKTEEEEKEEMQARYEHSLVVCRDGGGEVEMVRNENYYNPPQYSRWEWFKMIVTPSPQLPVAHTTTYQFYNHYDQDTNRGDYRNMYPDASKSDLRRWFPRYYPSDSSSSGSFKHHCQTQDRMMAEHSALLQRTFDPDLYDQDEAGPAPPQTPSASESGLSESVRYTPETSFVYH